MAKDNSIFKVKAIDLIEEINGNENIKNFDKHKCIENIRELLKTSKVRIGQIEKDAGCNAGYLSRLEKEDNKSDPSMEFICTAAKLLNVTLDSLVKGNLKSMTPTESYLMQFLSRLIEDTKSDNISWHKESANFLSKVGFDINEIEAAHPLFEVYTEIMESDYPEPAGTEYKSRFSPDDNMTPFGNSYNAQLTGTSESVYLMSVFSDADCETEILELYIVGYDVNPICATVQTCESVTEAMKDLYKEIEIATSHIQINNRSKDIIAQYLNGISDDDIPF